MNDADLLMHLMRPDIWADPYPLYRDLRAREPVHIMATTPTIVLARHASVTAVLQDRRFSNDWPRWQKFVRPLDPEEHAINERILAFFGLWMQTNDAERHQRLRGLVSETFTPRMLEGIRVAVERASRDLLSAAKSRGGVIDLVADYAKPLPEFVMCHLFGLDPASAERFNRCSQALFSYIGTPSPAPGQLAEIEGEIRDIRAFLLPMIEHRRVHPGADLISQFVRAGDGLSSEEIVVQCANMLAAGHETTTALITNGYLALLRNPAQMALLRDDRSLLPNAIEELLRFDSPSQFLPRIAGSALEFQGIAMPAGQKVFLAIGAACHDERVFAAPEQLDVTRPLIKIKKPLSFGGGAHYCLGAMLARLTARIAFDHLLDSLAQPRLVGEQVQWQPNFVMRHLAALPVAFAA